jgi:hypothetical protein
VSFLGEVYKPEDVIKRKRKNSVLSPGLGNVPPNNLQDVMREVRLLKIEVEKIKRSLKSNGIVEEIYDEGKS